MGQTKQRVGRDIKRKRAKDKRVSETPTRKGRAKKYPGRKRAGSRREGRGICWARPKRARQAQEREGIEDRRKRKE
jgi:hypothetical protein